MATPFYKGCDHRLRFLKAKDPSRNPINDAVCTYTITKDSDGTVVASGTMPYIASSSGNYWVTIDKVVTDTIVIDARYTAKLVVVDLAGNNDERYIELYGAKRR